MMMLAARGKSPAACSVYHLGLRPKPPAALLAGTPSPRAALALTGLGVDAGFHHRLSLVVHHDRHGRRHLAPIELEHVARDRQGQLIGRRGFISPTSIAMWATSWLASYCVPHWPVWLFTIKWNSPPMFPAQRVYSPAGMWESRIIRSLSVTSVVASSAPSPPDAARHRLDALPNHPVLQVRAAVRDGDVGVVHHPGDLDVRAAALAGMNFHRLAAAQHLRRRRGRLGGWFGLRRRRLGHRLMSRFL